MKGLYCTGLVILDLKNNLRCVLVLSFYQEVKE